MSMAIQKSKPLSPELTKDASSASIFSHGENKEILSRQGSNESIASPKP